MKRVSLAVLALMLLALIGCSKAPEAEMQAAKSAFDAAKAAEAEQYAPASYKVANDTLTAANAAKTDESFQGYLDRFVFGVANHEEYLEAVGGAARLDELRARGINPFPNDFHPTDTAAAVHERYGALELQAAIEEALSRGGVPVFIRPISKPSKRRERASAWEAISPARPAE